MAFWFFASYIKGADWFAAICYVAAVGMTSATLGFFYLLLAASGRVVVSIDATGFKDTRVTPALIPWSAIESVSPYVPYKSRSPAGVEVVIGPAFRQEISIRLGARLFAGASFLWRRAIRLDTRILDVDCNEISRIAN